MSDDKSDDIISYCGSMTGETWIARREKSAHTRKQLNIDSVAQKLREQMADNFDQEKIPDKSSAEVETKRANTSFHKLRLVMVILGGFAVGLMAFLRYSLAVAIISMVNQTALYMEEHPNNTMEDFLAEGYTEGGDFNWNNEIQQMLMSWYMLAYSLPQLPCTKIALSFGSRKAMPICLLICALSVLLTPTVAYWGWDWVLALRLMQGIGASAIFPLALNIIERWMPYEELALGVFWVGVLEAGLASVPNVLIGYLCDIHWSLAFYVPGAATLTFCIIWFVFVTDKPEESRLISSKELELIYADTGKDNPSKSVDGEKSGSQEKQKLSCQLDCKRDEFHKPTWLDVFRVPCFYAYIVIWIFYCCSHAVFLFVLPTYLSQFMKVNLSTNGFYCTIIESGTLFSVIWPHPFIQTIQRKFNLSAETPRRLAFMICCLVAGGTWIYIGASHDYQLIVFFINQCFQQSIDVIFVGNLMKNFSKSGICSEAFSMVNTVGNLSILYGSTLTGYVLDYTGQSALAWSWIFIVLGLSQLIQIVIFCTLIGADPVEIKGRRKKIENSEG